jgi:glycosyltransferase involved in cell wall biosynthesis
MAGIAPAETIEALECPDRETRLRQASGPAPEPRKFEGGLRTRGAASAQQAGTPLVSIITVVYNSAAFIEQTILSVLNQSYAQIEYIIIDGGSTDGTLEAIRKHEHAIDYWISEPDGGIYHAMNKGIQLCTGQIVGIINAGDWYEEWVVSAVVEVFSSKKADVVYGDLCLVDLLTGIPQLVKPKLHLLRESMVYLGHPTVFIKSDLYARNRFNTDFSIAADYEFILGLYVAGCAFEYCDNSVTNMRTGGTSSSFATIVEVFKVHRKYYGSFCAIRVLSLSTLRWGYFNLRRAIVKKMLPATVYHAAREKWVRRRNNKNR